MDDTNSIYPNNKSVMYNDPYDGSVICRHPNYKSVMCSSTYLLSGYYFLSPFVCNINCPVMFLLPT